MKRVFLAGVLLLVLAGCGSSGSGDDIGTDNVPAFDPESYAEQYNVSIEEAERRLVRHGELRALMDEIRSAEQRRLIGGRTVHEPEFGYWFYLDGEDPPTETTLAILRANDDLHFELGADMPDDEPEDTHQATEEEIVDFDAPFYAREHNVSIEEAKRCLIRGEELSALGSEIRSAEGDRVVGMRRVHEPEFGQWIYLSGDDPPTATTLEIMRANEDLHVELGAE